MQMRFIPVLCILLAASVWGATLPADQLAAQPARTREAQLREFHEVFKPEYDSYLGFGWLYFPSPKQEQLQTPYGTLPGFAFRNRLAVLVQNPLDSGSSLRSGLGWWVERQGWDNEDFLAIPNYSKFGAVRDIHTVALTLADRQIGWGAALGLQWQNPEHLGSMYAKETDTLWWFAQAGWDKLTLQTEFHRTEWRLLRVNAELADRALRGGDSTGWRTYLPDLEALVVRNPEDPLRLWGQQNLWKQILYFEGAWWPVRDQDRWIAFKAYTDASHLLGIEAGWRRLPNGEWIWGAGFEVPFLRVSYNTPREYDQFFHQHNAQILVEFQISLGTVAKSAIFRRNGAASAPMETDKVKKDRHFDESPDSDGAKPIKKDSL